MFVKVGCFRQKPHHRPYLLIIFEDTLIHFKWLVIWAYKPIMFGSAGSTSCLGALNYFDGFDKFIISWRKFCAVQGKLPEIMINDHHYSRIATQRIPILSFDVPFFKVLDISGMPTPRISNKASLPRRRSVQ